MTEFVVTRLKGAEHRDWMMSRTSLRRAIITGELSIPSLVEVVSNIVGVWPLIVVYLKETGGKTDGDSLVVNYIRHIFYCICNFTPSSGCLLFRRRESMARSEFCLFHLILEICKSNFLHFPHLAHVGTYTFRKKLLGDSRKLVAMFLVSSFETVGFFTALSLLCPCGIGWASFLVFGGLVWAAEFYFSV